MGLIPEKTNILLHAQYAPSRDDLDQHFTDLSSEERAHIPLLIEKYADVITPEEMRHIYKLVCKDIEDAVELCVEKACAPKGRPPFYDGTAGKPLDGKSTIQHRLILDNPDFYENAAFADPDRWGILIMRRSYQMYLMGAAMIARHGADYRAAQQLSYDIARPGSNIIANHVRQISYENGWDLVDGTTGTGAHMERYYQALKARDDRTIILRLTACPEEVRLAGVDWRADKQGYYQVTPEDVRNKGLLYPQRLPVYFQNGDVLDFFWSDGVTQNARHAATLDRGRLIPYDTDAMKLWEKKYDADRALLKGNQGMDLPSLNELTNKYAQRLYSTSARRSFPNRYL